MTQLDQEMLDALRVYDNSLHRDTQWGENFFGIDPFYIAIGTVFSSRVRIFYVLMCYIGFSFFLFSYQALICKESLKM